LKEESVPNLPHEIPPNAEDIRSYLERVVPGSRVTKAFVNPEYQPLVLLETSRMMAAFAFSNGDMRKTYDELYGSFKNYYAERQGQWNDRELAFVFCVAPDAPQLERFSSNVETNVYFCRKYVIALGSRLEASLARLPFLPLAPLGGRPFRPASAQTFLRQCRVPATLAKNLVVPQQRSAQGIVKDCLSGTFGEPHALTSAANTRVPEIEAEAATNPVHLNTVEIKNFRAYRKTQTFTIGADITVLSGPNGFGKTSFFDAIDFAVTGGIGRIRSANETQFKKIATHLDSTEEESSVSLSLLRDGAAHNIKRTVNDPKRALLDGKTFDRKAILTEVTAGNIPAADRVENFANLFRATHIFGQQQAELTRDFQDDCQLPE
jgi:exonuclease SbcC